MANYVFDKYLNRAATGGVAEAVRVRLHNIPLPVPVAERANGPSVASRIGTAQTLQPAAMTTSAAGVSATSGATAFGVVSGAQDEDVRSYSVEDESDNGVMWWADMTAVVAVAQNEQFTMNAGGIGCSVSRA